jgi:Reverse transcriptase (RNA-dependent DNA polymerase)
VIHVDDMLFAGSTTEIIDESHKSLSQSFEVKDLGEVKQFIGIDIHKSSDRFFCINQSQYITKISSELGLSQAKPQKYPIHPGYLNMTCEDFLSSNSEYRKVIGMLLYVSTNFRPDISAFLHKELKSLGESIL